MTSAGKYLTVVARLSRNVDQFNHVLVHSLCASKAEWRPGAGEEGFAGTKHDWVKVDSILINKTEVRQASRQVRACNVNLSIKLSLQLADCRLEVVRDKGGVGADGLQRSRHDPLRLAPPRHRELAFLRAPLRTVFVPIAHHLVHAATVHTAGQAANLFDEVTKELGAWRKRRVVDVAVQRLVHAKDELRHIRVSPSQGTLS